MVTSSKPLDLSLYSLSLFYCSIQSSSPVGPLIHHFFSEHCHFFLFYYITFSYFFGLFIHLHSPACCFTSGSYLLLASYLASGFFRLPLIWLASSRINLLLLQVTTSLSSVPLFGLDFRNSLIVGNKLPFIHFHLRASLSARQFLYQLSL